MTQHEQPQPLTEFLPSDFARPDQTLDEALSDHHVAARAYQEWLAGIPAEALHRLVGGQYWTPAEHADHVIKGVRLIAGMLRACADGQPMPDMAMGYQYADGRVATDALRPASGRSRDQLLADLEAGGRDLESAVTELRHAGKLDMYCVATGLFSPLNTLEAVQLCASHYAHHMPEWDAGSDQT